MPDQGRKASKGFLAMRETARILLSLSLGSSLFVPLVARGQDASAPSLGDAARKARQQKQNEEPQAQSSKPAIVLNDEDLATRTEPAQISKTDQHPSPGASHAGVERKLTADQWKSLILAQKSQILSTQTSIDQLSQLVYFHSSTQVRWNERQREKQHQVERLQTQLEVQKKQLGEMQEAARRQGYGNAVYDP